MDETLVDLLERTDSMTVEVVRFIPIFGTAEGADRYFSLLLYGQLWSLTALDRKTKALVEATSRINALNFVGYKTEKTQPLEFPRNDETIVPQDIQEATYELALSLLKGIDPDTELDNIYVRSRYIGKLRTDYAYEVAPEHKLAGIPNIAAWRKLKPYLSQNVGLRMRREN